MLSCWPHNTHQETALIVYQSLRDNHYMVKCLSSFSWCIVLNNTICTENICISNNLKSAFHFISNISMFRACTLIRISVFTAETFVVRVALIWRQPVLGLKGGNDASRSPVVETKDMSREVLHNPSPLALSQPGTQHIHRHEFPFADLQLAHASLPQPQQ